MSSIPILSSCSLRPWDFYGFSCSFFLFLSWGTATTMTPDFLFPLSINKSPACPACTPSSACQSESGSPPWILVCFLHHLWRSFQSKLSTDVPVCYTSSLVCKMLLASDPLLLLYVLACFRLHPGSWSGWLVDPGFYRSYTQSLFSCYHDRGLCAAFSSHW